MTGASGRLTEASWDRARFAQAGDFEETPLDEYERTELDGESNNRVGIVQKERPNGA